MLLICLVNNSRTPCEFCHSLMEDGDDHVEATHEAPADIHPDFAFLFQNSAQKSAETNTQPEEETIVRTLAIDAIFAHNHGINLDSGEDINARVMKKFHHPPVGKYGYCPPLVELPDFFSGDVCNEEQQCSRPMEDASGNNNINVEQDNGAGLGSFFDDFVTSTPAQTETKPQPETKEHRTLILRTPTKTVVKKIVYSSNNITAGRCLCQSRYEHLKKGSSQTNPHDPNVVHDKYWAQRRRLFKKFDEGIQLDSEGWYSVTPEVVADHVGWRFVEAAEQLLKGKNNNTAGKGGRNRKQQPIVILDAFCGCGGNAIAFAKLPPSSVSRIICIDVDRQKLRMAAHNASIYSIPPHRIIFVEANSVAVLERCYRDGILVMDPPPRTPEGLAAYPPREIYNDFTIGGIDLLAEYATRIDAIFMDPPWGGVDYGSVGKDGYDLKRDMKIRGCQRGCVGFPPTPEVDGVRLLKIAAAATSTRFVGYDLPRNANKKSLAEAAVEAGYEGNCKLEEHYLNGRLKTVTAYFGLDFRRLLDLRPDRDGD